MELEHESAGIFDPSGAGGAQAGDLTALAWVHDEVRRSLETANKSLRRLLREIETRSLPPMVGGMVPAVQQARSLVHQSTGVLEMVGLPHAAKCLSASELVLQRLGGDPHAVTPEVVGTLERLSFAVQDYLGRLLSGQPVSPLALFPPYREAMQIVGADRIHPADLYPVPAINPGAVPVPSATPLMADERLRTALESALLNALRGRPGAAARMSRLYAGLANGEASGSELAGLWTLAAAFYDAQANGALPADALSRRLESRLLSQLRAAQRGATQVPLRLLQDLWFFCSRAQSPAVKGQSPILQMVRSALKIPDLSTQAYDDSALGRFDPALVPQARRRVAGFKEIWAVASAGDAVVLPACVEQVSIVGESVRQLYPQGERLAVALETAVRGCAAQSRAPSPELAMEVATALLCLDATLDDLNQPGLGERIAQLAARLHALVAGQPAAPIEPWMEDLYRDVSDRQTMGSVVQELRAALAEAEQQLDRFHRHPADHELLVPVPGQLGTMRGVLNVLGLSAAAQAVQRMRGDVEQMIAGQGDVATATARLADNLGVMSFLIDMLGVQPALAKSLFRFDPDTGAFTAVMGRAVRSDTAAQDQARLRERAQALAGSIGEAALSHDDVSRELEALVDQAEAADQTDVAEAASRAREALAQVDGAADRDAALADAAQAIAAIAETPAPSTPAPLAPPAPVDDDEDMREVFYEEAGEVIAGARQALQDLQADARDLGAMTTVRRAFHTLKGSSRMVHLRDLGEAAWACEQLYNSRLALADVLVDPALHDFSVHAFQVLEDWVHALAAAQEPTVDGPGLIARATALREGTTPPVAAEPEHPVAAPLPVDEPLTAAVDNAEPTAPLALPQTVELPALDLDLDLGDDAPTPTEPELTLLDLPETPPDVPAVSASTVPDDSLDFALDLDLDEVTPSTEVMAPPAEPAPTPVAAAEPDAAPPAAGESAFDEPLPDLVLPLVDPFDVPADIPLSLQKPDESAPQWLPTDAGLPLDLQEDPVDSTTEVDLLLEPLAPETPAPTAAPAVDEPAAPSNVVPLPVRTVDDDAERYKVIGSLRVPITLFNIYLNEADEQSRRLGTELAEWKLELDRPVGETAVALAHSLAGNSATVGFTALSQLARRLEHRLEHAQAQGHGQRHEADLFADVAEEIRRLLHQFAAGMLREPDAAVLERLSQQEAHDAAQVSATGRAPLPAGFDDEDLDDGLGATPQAASEGSVPAPAVAPLATDDIDAVDAIDPELFDIFIDEARELIPALAEHVRDWELEPQEVGHGVAAMRALHTLKGGARLAGAMRLGEMAHRLESVVEQLTAHNRPNEVAAIAQLHPGIDALTQALQQAQQPGAAVLDIDVSAPATPGDAPAAALAEPVPAAQISQADPAAQPAPVAGPEPAADEVPAPAAAPTDTAEPRQIDWAAFQRLNAGHTVAATVASESVAAGVVRVRAVLLDRLVNHAGEVGTTRGRLDAEVGQMRTQMRELSDNLERLRHQLRDLEIQAETQMSSRLEAARQSRQAFDPLEMDRFTRVQELTRMMAESVGDVGTVQRSLQQALQSSEDLLADQARLTRNLQDDLLRARMVEFDTLSDRLYRVVRQAAKETGKQVRLNITGGTVELDRGVLDRIAPTFEHLLRNAVVHGIEAPALREATGKSPIGTINVALRPSGNEVRIEVDDDGAGLDLARIAERARGLGLLGADDRPTESELSQLIFRPGFSTADEVTELAGRGIGMEVVRSDVTAMGGRVETRTRAGQGTTFELVLPLTTAVTQVVMVSCDGLVVAVPSTIVEQVRRVPAADIAAAYAAGVMRHGEQDIAFHWMGALLQHGVRGEVEGRMAQVLIVRSASQWVAVHVSEVLGNQEVVVKNLGPQLSRLPGLAGMSLRVNGEPVLIYNPVALAAVYGEQARARLLSQPTQEPTPAAVAVVHAPVTAAPLVLVVDDSLTVRRVTQRLLQREGYRVALARDGLEALEQLTVERPTLMLTDIEMPRMDGFDLVHNVKAEPRWAELPIIMITSRIAEKHRDHARELGVDHYLGKPYDEDTLLALVKQYAGPTVATAPTS